MEKPFHIEKETLPDGTEIARVVYENDTSKIKPEIKPESKP